MLDHVFLTVSDVERSISFYTAALNPLGINQRFDYDGKNGQPAQASVGGAAEPMRGNRQSQHPDREFD